MSFGCYLSRRILHVNCSIFIICLQVEATLRTYKCFDAVFGWFLGLVRTHRPRAEGIVMQSSRGKVLVKLISLTGFPQVLQHIMTTKYVTRYVTLKFYNI